MRVVLADYRNKGLGLAKVLAEAGHELVGQTPFEAVFVDHDEARANIIETGKRFGAKVFVYPHSAHPQFLYDGVLKPHPDVTALLVQSPGDKWLQESFGHKRPVIEIGWFYCDQEPFKAKEPENVLFAPLHPWADGFTMLEDDRERNTEAFRRVLNLGLPVTVRYLGSLEGNGIWEEPGVTYVQGKPDNSLSDIDSHDLVVSKETFAYLAVARGVPTVFFGQDHAPCNDIGTVYVRNWDTYSDTVRYPFDMADSDLSGAWSDTEAVNAWRAQWIGEPLTVERLPI